MNGILGASRSHYSVPFEKATKIGSCEDGGVWVEIKWTGDRLSLMGVIGPRRDGNARGGCGQIDRSIVDDDSFRANVAAVTRADVERLLDVWDRWHLNDMRAGTPAQQQHVREHRSEFSTLHFYEDACASLAAAGLLEDPEHDGYKYGSAWLREDVPADVIAFLRSLPDNTSTFPWRERAL